MYVRKLHFSKYKLKSNDDLPNKGESIHEQSDYKKRSPIRVILRWLLIFLIISSVLLVWYFLHNWPADISFERYHQINQIKSQLLFNKQKYEVIANFIEEQSTKYSNHQNVSNTKLELSHSLDDNVYLFILNEDNPQDLSENIPEEIKSIVISQNIHSVTTTIDNVLQNRDYIYFDFNNYYKDNVLCYSLGTDTAPITPSYSYRNAQKICDYWYIKFYLDLAES